MLLGRLIGIISPLEPPLPPPPIQLLECKARKEELCEQSDEEQDPCVDPQLFYQILSKL